MSTLGSKWFLVSMCAGSLLFVVAARAEKKSPAPADRAAQKLVNSALQAEVAGTPQERAWFLEEARKRHPDFAAARWHSGQVLLASRWVAIEDVPALYDADKLRQEYRRMRDGKLATLDNHVAIADWCERNGLRDEARGHLLAALQIDPEHAAVRARLGFRRVGNTWITQSDYEAARAWSQQFQRDLAKWKPKVEPLAKRLEAGKVARPLTDKEIDSVRDVAAIPALELVLAEKTPVHEELLVNVLSGMKEQSATAALARRAVLSPFDNARRQATEELGKRPWDSMVPQLLSAMYMPTEVTLEADPLPGGLASFRAIFTREAQSTVEFAVDDMAISAYLYFPRNGALVPNFNISVALQVMLARSALARQVVLNENARTAWLNDRIAATTNGITEQTIPANPRRWWAWWNDYNEMQPSEKRVVEWWYCHDYHHVQVVSSSCFVAGTPVWTVSGPRPIEDIQVGDLVLAQHSDTGELSYKPVMHRTLRDPVELVKLTTETDAIDCTGGHPFWVAGRGWVHARRLKAGDRLHAVNGACEVKSLATGEKKPTYNLVVADFNSYFVGQGKLLVHDTAPKGPTTTLVPGLLVEK